MFPAVGVSGESRKLLWKGLEGGGHVLNVEFDMKYVFSVNSGLF